MILKRKERVIINFLIIMQGNMTDRSEKEIRLRNNQAQNYDMWYMERGEGSVYIEDRSVIEALNLNLNEILLDIGCGTGRVTSQLATRCKKCFGIDISDKSIEILNRRNIENLKGDVIDITVEDIPYNMQFDKILSMQAIQHIEPVYHESVCKKIYNALKDGGVFVCELYNFSGLQRKLEMIRHRTKKITVKGDFYEYRFTPDEFCKLMKKTGYKEIECYGVCNFHRKTMNAR